MVNDNIVYAQKVSAISFTAWHYILDRCLAKLKTNCKNSLPILLVLFVGGTLSAPVLATANPLGNVKIQESIIPADVLSQINRIAQQLELIRKHLNLPMANHLNIEVSDAQPRQVYFQALALYERVNRFTFERLRIFHEEPNAEFVQGKELEPYHVWQLANQASVQLSAIIKDLLVVEEVTEHEVELTTSPSDVFMALLRVNRQLDVMLEQPFSPNDVYQQVTLGVHYMAKLLANFPETVRIPDAPLFVDNKKPADVWLLLAQCFDLIADISQNYSEKMLVLTINSATTNAIQPGDSYQYASLIVAELNHLYDMVGKGQPVVPTVAVDNKSPSDVYQRAGLLYKQLKSFKALSAKQVM
jgi:hypothetical protein